MAPARTQSTQVKNWIGLLSALVYLLVVPLLLLKLKHIFLPLLSPRAPMEALFKCSDVIGSTGNLEKRCMQSNMPSCIVDKHIKEQATTVFRAALLIGWSAAMAELAKIKRWSIIVWSGAVSFVVQQCCVIYGVGRDDTAFHTALAPVVLVAYHLCDEALLLMKKKPKECSDMRESNSDSS